MKINIWQIVSDHLNTLQDNVRGKISITDIVTFFFIPILMAILCYITGITSSKDFYNVSLTFFGVFVALLLNFQVAAFGIYNRKWNIIDDEKLSLNQEQELRLKMQLLREINANISYLILISIVSIVLFLLFYSIDIGRVAAVVSSIVYTHFILTLLMVIKRSHALFKKEYDEA